MMLSCAYIDHLWRSIPLDIKGRWLETGYNA